MRQLRRSSVAESPDVYPAAAGPSGAAGPDGVGTLSSSVSRAGQGSGVWGRVRGVGAGGSGSSGRVSSVLGGSSARPVAALLDVDVSSSGSFLQQQLQQLRGPQAPQVPRTGHAQATTESHQQQQLQSMARCVEREGSIRSSCGLDSRPSSRGGANVDAD